MKSPLDAARGLLEKAAHDLFAGRYPRKHLGPALAADAELDETRFETPLAEADEDDLARPRIDDRRIRD